MTNNEYEKMMVEAALRPTDNGKTKESEMLRACDVYIDSLEKSLDIARERRRELINRFNLNKGDSNA